MDMLNQSHSPLTFAMQYVGTLLQGAGSRLCLLWIPSGVGSIDEWYAAHPDKVRACRRLWLLVAGHLHQRHRRHYTSWPWKLCGVADKRRTVEERRALAEEFRALPPGLARRLHCRNLTVAYMINDPVAQVFFASLAKLATMTIADVEWWHGRHRERSQQ